MSSTLEEMGRPLLITKGNAMISLGGLAAVLTIASVLHAKWVMPSILVETRRQTEAQVREHASRPHLDAVSREELRAIQALLSTLATRDQVNGVEKQISQLDKRIERLESK